ncbi:MULTISPECIES: FadR/GntR family transcriptional regulator [Niallia]|uniref:GntR family transcriptional regulator n=1 Tax=Niallia circulans TaxID=1397 RepID=A0A268F8X1_NIACI|nr:GntR family transcriptional regulator [Niallia circulans]AYV67462.1 FadR family transcriptional regulator [Niallia circulans]AYV74180.1 FadR family transcriptional regulator [Niallia circulans]NRG28282.1 FadR family transcriptional regulator [Niallia circulans]PAD81825.1 GntR family transcriptional regulator [Niallia circulans]QJX63410.1 FadR family transcriptional regulator [Niallia circulans]
MNESSSKESKLYVDIVNHLREMINQNGLKPGDKLPSERVLSDTLHAGRSSIREALRALELLGLIETRKGEGTFLRDFQGHKLVELISTFILQNDKAKQDVLETKNYIQLNALYIAMEKITEDELAHLKQLVNEREISESEFFFQIIKIADNFLVHRLWTILNDYYHSLTIPAKEWKREDYLLLLDSLKQKNQMQLWSVFSNYNNFN